jgi:cysteinyl-tRNA synthetase
LLVQRHRAAITIGKNVKMFLARRRYFHVRRRLATIQMAVRRWIVARRCRKKTIMRAARLKAQNRKEEAAERAAASASAEGARAQAAEKKEKREERAHEALMQDQSQSQQVTYLEDEVAELRHLLAQERVRRNFNSLPLSYLKVSIFQSRR